VDDGDGAGPGGDLPGDVDRVEAEVVLAEDVREHDRGAGEQGRVRGGDEGEARADDLVAGADAERDVGEVQRGGAVRQREDARGAERLAEAPLELGGALAHREPAGRDHLPRGLLLLGAERQVAEGDLPHGRHHSGRGAGRGGRPVRRA
jgi:hypothetical protein